MARKVCIDLKDEVYEKAKKIAEENGFGSLEEYIVFLVEESLAFGEGDEVFSAEDEEKVKERLKDLGYM